MEAMKGWLRGMADTLYWDDGMQMKVGQSVMVIEANNAAHFKAAESLLSMAYALDFEPLIKPISGYYLPLKN